MRCLNYAAQQKLCFDVIESIGQIPLPPTSIAHLKKVIRSAIKLFMQNQKVLSQHPQPGCILMQMLQQLRDKNIE